MMTEKNSDVFKVLLSLSVIYLLTSCGGSSSSETVIPTPVPVIYEIPANIQVVSGDGDSTEIQNTISWDLVTDATSYIVYWDYSPGVTIDSSIVVPSTQGYNNVTHSDANVVSAATYYYRVRAVFSAGMSDLSDEVSGIPQRSITNNGLSDVSWNGVDTVVAVGDSGTIISSADAMADAWIDTSDINTSQTLTGVVWETTNYQFLIVGAGNTVLTGDGTNWDRMDLRNLKPAVNFEDVAWLGDKYIAVGKSGAILLSDFDGSAWTKQDAGSSSANVSFNAVATNGTRMVVVGSNGTIIHSLDGINWIEQITNTNNDLNDISWDDSQFTIVGSNDTVLTSPDGTVWTSHIPGTADISFVGSTHWDSSLPQNPILGAVGSAGTFVITPDAAPGIIIKTGTNEQLAGITWIDDGANLPYFVMVGNDGTVLTSRVQ